MGIKRFLYGRGVSHGTIGTHGGDLNPEAGSKEEYESALGPGWRVWGKARIGIHICCSYNLLMLVTIIPKRRES